MSMAVSPQSVGRDDAIVIPLQAWYRAGGWTGEEDIVWGWGDGLVRKPLAA